MRVRYGNRIISHLFLINMASYLSFECLNNHSTNMEIGLFKRNPNRTEIILSLYKLLFLTTWAKIIKGWLQSEKFSNTFQLRFNKSFYHKKQNETEIRVHLHLHLNTVQCHNWPLLEDPHKTKTSQFLESCQFIEGKA